MKIDKIPEENQIHISLSDVNKFFIIQYFSILYVCKLKRQCCNTKRLIADRRIFFRHKL